MPLSHSQHPSGARVPHKVSHSTLGINMTTARRNKLTPKDKINLIDASGSHSQRQY